MINADFDPDQMNKLHDLLERKARDINKQLVIAINATVNTVKSRIAKDLTKQINLKQKTIKKLLTSPKTATVNSLSARVQIKRTKQLNLKFFGARASKKGVRVKILKSEGFKLFPHAFIPPVQYRNKVFERLGKARGPLKNLKGPSVAEVFEGKMRKTSELFIKRELFRQIERRIRFIALKKSGAI